MGCGQCQATTQALTGCTRLHCIVLHRQWMGGVKTTDPVDTYLECSLSWWRVWTVSVRCTKLKLRNSLKLKPSGQAAIFVREWKHLDFTMFLHCIWRECFSQYTQEKGWESTNFFNYTLCASIVLWWTWNNPNDYLTKQLLWSQSCAEMRKYQTQLSKILI